MEIHSQYHHVGLSVVEGEDPFNDDVDYTMATPGYSCLVDGFREYSC